MTLPSDWELQRVRKELTATRIVALGLLLVVLLSLSGVSRTVVHGALLAVLLVTVFLGCRWGLGDTELSVGQSIGLTLGVAVVFLLLFLWGGR
jgi:uncharacterized membrane protein YecN with MAPEG domain